MHNKQKHNIYLALSLGATHPMIVNNECLIVYLIDLLTSPENKTYRPLEVLQSRVSDLTLAFQKSKSSALVFDEVEELINQKWIVTGCWTFNICSNSE